ncbi:hypothetical protein [Micrococcus flavus]|uniref:Uncharacterized protein n=2 Tax=Micrococcus flavus TaxID=384602 RepID=A0A7W7L4P6_9MICC|nr:hypothetical protein [Micrococcus flavus]MBB4883509.1 hypothetical protein [Micrococcus flavus]GGK53822.1 hypothetical protein GCM10007073_21050 [Micrococcus flavus]
MTTSFLPTAPLTRSQERALGLRPSALAPGGRVYGPVMAAALAASTLPDPNGGSRARRDRVQRVLAAASGLYGAAEAGAAVRCARLAAGRPTRGRARLAAAGLGAAGGAALAGLSLAAAPVNRRVDAWLVRGLEAVGVTRPRWTLAGLTAAAVLAGNAADRAARREAVETALGLAEPAAEGADGGLALVDVPVGARAVLETLLDAAPAGRAALPGGDALRAQLPHVRAADLGEGVTFTDWLPLVVADDATVERAVPHDFTWPVRARFEHGGAEFELTLRVVDGELGALAVEPVDETRDESWEARATLERWPRVDEVRLVVDGAARTSA